jgi:repressor LexA
VSKKASEKGLSINSLEDMAGVSTGSIYKWNKVSPTIRNLQKVANILECTIDELIE